VISGTVFYTPRVLPVTQPSVSKHRREHKALTLTSGLTSSFLHPQPDFRWKGRCCTLTPVLQLQYLEIPKKYCHCSIDHDFILVLLVICAYLTSFSRCDFEMWSVIGRKSHIFSKYLSLRDRSEPSEFCS